MEIRLKQGDIVGMLKDKISAYGKVKEGTYNRADPTRYVKGEATFELLHGYKTDPESDMPLPEAVLARFNDCTWGTDFVFFTSIGEISAYFDHSDKGWCHPDERFEEVFIDVLINGAPEGTYIKKCKECGSTEMKSADGHPGEYFLLCAACDNIIDSYVCESEIM